MAKAKMSPFSIHRAKARCKKKTNLNQ